MTKENNDFNAKLNSFIEKLTNTEKRNLEDIIKSLKEEDLKAINERISACTSPIEQKDKSGNILLTKEQTIFRAFDLFDLSETKVLILGQDPYPEPDKAHGLAFSVSENYEKFDDSLKHIYETIANYLDKEFDENNKKKYKKDLSEWAKTNKVLLLNTALTHESSNSKIIEKHRNVWKSFVVAIIQKLIKHKIAVFLWGQKAQATFHDVIEDLKYNEVGEILVLSTSHPSNQGYKRGFRVESPKHFEVCDKFLDIDIWKNLWDYVTE